MQPRWDESPSPGPRFARVEKGNHMREKAVEGKTTITWPQNVLGARHATWQGQREKKKLPKERSLVGQHRQTA